LPPDSTGESKGSPATTLKSLLALFNYFTDTGDGSAGAHAANDNINLAIGIYPDFFRSGSLVNFLVGRVLSCWGTKLKKE